MYPIITMIAPMTIKAQAIARGIEVNQRRIAPRRKMKKPANFISIHHPYYNPIFGHRQNSG
jgi:hypothetical protein